MAVNQNVLTLDQVRDEYKIPIGHIKAGIHAGELTSYPVGRKLFVDRKELEAWIKSRAMEVKDGKS